MIINIAQFSNATKKEYKPRNKNKQKKKKTRKNLRKHPYWYRYKDIEGKVDKHNGQKKKNSTSGVKKHITQYLNPHTHTSMQKENIHTHKFNATITKHNKQASEKWICQQTKYFASLEVQFLL